MSRRAFDLDEPYSVREILERDPDSALAHTQPGNGLPLGWHSLHMFNGPGCRDKRTAAATYGRLGLHPIALHGAMDDGACTCGNRVCPAAGKHPIGNGWQRGPLDTASVDRLLEENPRRNLGLRMGRQPCGRNLIALDVDGPRELLAPLEAMNGPLPSTLTARTGRGLHFLFWLPEGLTVKNRVRLAPGVDVRAEGGQIVAPPSRHVTGALYEWIDIREPAVLP